MLQAVKTRKPRAARKGAATPLPAGDAGVAQDAARRVHDLAWAGRHDEAIAASTAALGVSRLPASTCIDLLDLRAESLLALGRLAEAEADAAQMLAIAEKRRSPAFRARALCRRAMLEMRSGRLRQAVASAKQALPAARRARNPGLVASALLHLGEASGRARDDLDGAVALTGQAIAMLAKLGDPSALGRAYWVLSMGLSAQAKADLADRAAAEALRLCRSCGDLYGVGNALNMLMFNEADLGRNLTLLKEAFAAFESTGYVGRQGMIVTNLGIGYRALGLYRRARRQHVKARDIYLAAGDRQAATGSLWQMAIDDMLMGRLSTARALFAEASIATAGTDLAKVYPHFEPLLLGQLSLLEGDPTAAAANARRAIRAARGINDEAGTMNALVGLGRALVALGDPRRAVAATRRAAAMHRAHGLSALQGLDGPELWLRHSEALRASGDGRAAREALECAYQLMLKGIAGISDEGLRRNFLAKGESNREIVVAWVADARKRRLARERVTAHLAGQANVREPFERLVDSGLRLNELRSVAELHEFLIDEATELSGAERVLLVLEEDGRRVLAGSLLPAGEDAAGLLRRVGRAIDEVRRTRVARLAHTPSRGDRLDQRSSVVAPLLVRGEVKGYLYADLDGLYGRFHDADRDLLAMLASQGAIALENARWSEDLERRVAERTRELQASHEQVEARTRELAASNAQTEARVAELEVINSIQQGMARELEFQGIVDLVGDRLREVFASDDLGINWLDPKTDLIHHLYACEHGQRLALPPNPAKRDSKLFLHLASGEPMLLPTRAAIDDYGIGTTPGTDPCKCVLWVPILIGGELRASLQLESFEREHAFDDAVGSSRVDLQACKLEYSIVSPK